MRVGALEQRHVIRVLEIGQADDARFAVRAAAVVSGWKAIEAQDVGAALGEVIQSGAADAACAQDDAVVGWSEWVHGGCLRNVCAAIDSR